MKKLLLAASLLLAGCAPTYQVRVDADQAPVNTSVSELCPPAPDAPKKDQTGQVPSGEWVKFGSIMVGLYGECALRDAAKLEWIKSQGH